MPPTGAQFMQGIAERGIPDQWQRLGWVLAYDGAISTHLVRAVQEAHESGSAEARDAALRLFDEKQDNLAEARQFIASKLDEYDASERWAKLDAVIREVDVDQLVDELRPHFGFHPFPIVLESFKFNINYIREHGFRTFYTMTDAYLTEIEKMTREGRAAFEAREGEQHFPPFWLFKLDLNSIEVPTHCDICRLAITYAERALEDAEQAG
ncbi:hypothetical protein AB8O55_29660 [Saccharopolyspora cebuensis]|uniref:Uncharacterized protein n=1 Tax=Saccharopolyspora cebuensis TaxID=418759 RepID=A0ABV4CR78_9PSEU